MYQMPQTMQPTAGAAAYRQNQVMYLTPRELLLKVYDIAIGACVQENAERSRAALCELIDSLNFDYAEITVGLLRLYNYCLDLVRDGKFEDASHILGELRATWAMAMGQQPTG